MGHLLLYEYNEMYFIVYLYLIISVGVIYKIIKLYANCQIC
jgi:hypothetical protein